MMHPKMIMKVCKYMRSIDELCLVFAVIPPIIIQRLEKGAFLKVSEL